MLRPGRLDAVVPINEPDANAAAQLVKVYGRGLLSPQFDYTSVGEALKGNIPAVIRECVERAKAAAIDRLGCDITGKVDAEDVIVAVNAMKAQIDMIKHRKSTIGILLLNLAMRWDSKSAMPCANKLSKKLLANSWARCNRARLLSQQTMAVDIYRHSPFSGVVV